MWAVKEFAFVEVMRTEEKEVRRIIGDIEVGMKKKPKKRSDKTATHMNAKFENKSANTYN